MKQFLRALMLSLIFAASAAQADDERAAAVNAKPSLRARRSNPGFSCELDCFVVSLLAMTKHSCRS